MNDLQNLESAFMEVKGNPLIFSFVLITPCFYFPYGESWHSLGSWEQACIRAYHIRVCVCVCVRVCVRALKAALTNSPLGMGSLLVSHSAAPQKLPERCSLEKTLSPSPSPSELHTTSMQLHQSILHISRVFCTRI